MAVGGSAAATGAGLVGSSLLPLAALGAAAVGQSMLTGAVMAKTWNSWWPGRVRELVDSEGISRQEAMKRASAEWKSKGKSGGRMAKTTTVRGAPKLTAEIPMMVEAQPDLAAAWDVAQGVLDALRDNAAPRDDFRAFQRQAAAAFQRAKGDTSEADTAEYQMGQAIGRTLLLVAAQEGLTAADWQALTPPQLQADAGGVAGTAGSIIESLVGGATGLDIDVDGDGDSGLGDGILSLF